MHCLAGVNIKQSLWPAQMDEARQRAVANRCIDTRGREHARKMAVTWIGYRFKTSICDSRRSERGQPHFNDVEYLSIANRE